MSSAIIFLILGFVSLLLIYQDVTTQKVDLRCLLLFVILCCLLSVANPCFFPFFIFVAVDILYFLIKKCQCFGAADFFVVFGICFILPGNSCGQFLFLSGVFGCLSAFWFLKKKKINVFPFVPAMVISAAIVLFFGKCLGSLNL